VRRHAIIMGMPVTLDIPSSHDQSIFIEVFKELKLVDQQFSPFKKNSELSLFNAGLIPPDHLSIGMKAVMKACLEAEVMTDGYFSARYAKKFDPTGYVKGWAVAESSRKLEERGIGTFSLSAGGDVHTKSDSAKVCQIGIQDPRDKKSIIGKISGKNLAIATSGNYERGNHIINPKSGKPAHELLSLTVVGPNIIKADILATAAYAMGAEGLKFIDDKQPDYEVLAVDSKGTVMLSGGMRDLLTVV
jgi:thiamine biosynthesis lipoprotein